MKTKKQKNSKKPAPFFRRIWLGLFFLSVGFTTINAQCKATFTYSVSGNTVAFTNASTPNDTLKTFYWYFGDGSYSTGKKPPAHTYTNSGSFIVNLSMYTTDSAKSPFCYDYYSDTIAIDGAYQASFVYTNTSGEGLVSFTNTSTTTNTVVAYSWNFGDGQWSSSLEQHVTHNYSKSGTYLVTLTAYNPNDTTQKGAVTKTLYLYVKSSTTKCNAAFTYSVSGTSVLFTNKSTATNTLVAYTWDFADGSSSSAQHPSHMYQANGYYNVTLMIYNPHDTLQCNSTASEMVYYYSGKDSLINGSDSTLSCKAYFSIYLDSLDNTKFVGYNNSTTSNSNHVSYFWSWGDGTSSEEAYPNHTYNQAGNYSICLFIVDSLAGCTSNYCSTVPVYKKEAFIRSVEIKQPKAITTSIKKNIAVDNNRVVIAPNPFSTLTQVNYTINEKSQVDIRVYDAMGREVAVLENGNKPSGKYSAPFNDNGLPKGIYFLKVWMNNQVSTHKILLAEE